jgi:F-type H+-transporting ATPase subunit delta
LGARSAISVTPAAERYAAALFDLCQETGAVAAVESDAKALLAAIATSADLRAALASPLIPAEEKAGVLATLAAKMKLSTVSANFLGVVAKNARAAELAGALKAFLLLAAKARGSARADVAAAAPLSDEQVASLKASLEKAFNRPIEMDVTVKPDLLGGFVVKVGSKMFDASIRSKLDALKIAMKGA